jgi:hypothetical protein
MSDEWLDQLRQLHEADRAKRQTKAIATDKQKELAKRNQAASLLRRSQAHELMRQVQKLLLDGQGTLDILDETSHYERVITLVWQGPISAARRPNPDDPEEINYILVGVRQGKLWVNGREVSPGTPETLRTALLKACQNPGRTQRGALTGGK